jgi:hypothetical protein
LAPGRRRQYQRSPQVRPHGDGRTGEDGVDEGFGRAEEDGAAGRVQRQVEACTAQC